MNIDTEDNMQIIESEMWVPVNGWSHWFHWSKGGKTENEFQPEMLVHYHQIDGALRLLASIVYQLYEM